MISQTMRLPGQGAVLPCMISKPAMRLEALPGSRTFTYLRYASKHCRCPRDRAESTNPEKGTRQRGPTGVNVMKFPSLLSSVRRWRHYRETVQELSRLSDRELDDIGISRNEIFRIARRSTRPEY